MQPGCTCRTRRLSSGLGRDWSAASAALSGGATTSGDSRQNLLRLLVQAPCERAEDESRVPAVGATALAARRHAQPGIAGDVTFERDRNTRGVVVGQAATGAPREHVLERAGDVRRSDAPAQAHRI